MAVPWVGTKPGEFINNSVEEPIDQDNLNAIVNTIDAIANSSAGSGLDADTLDTTHKEGLEKPLDQDLVSYYSFESFSGSLTSEYLYDNSYRSIPGTIYNATLASGACGKSANFNGSSAYATGSYLDSTIFTLSCWYKGTEAGSNKKLVMLHRAITSPRIGLCLDAGVPKFKWVDATASNKEVSGISTINDDEWHHICGVYDGNQGTLYIDGLSKGSLIATLSASYYDLLKIAGGEENPVTNFTAGLIDEVRVYTRAFNEDEARGLYSSKGDIDSFKSSIESIAHTNVIRDSLGKIEAASIFLNEDQALGGFTLELKNNSGLSSDKTLEINISDANRVLNISGDTTVNQNVSTIGSPSFVTATLTQATGTAPLTVSSTTKVNNLNVDKVDGYDLNQGVQTTDSPSFVRITSTQATGSSPLVVASTTVVTNLNADQVDGLHSSSLVQVTGNQSIAGVKTFTDTTDSTTKDTGSVILEGGLGVEKAIYAGGIISTTSQLKSTVVTGTAPLEVASTTLVSNLNADQVDGLHSTSLVQVTGNQSIAGVKTFTDTTDSSSKDTGSIILEGGIGIEKKIFAGSDITTAGQLKSTVVTGTAPLSVASTTKVSNLNADKLDDLDDTDFVRTTGTVSQNISGVKTFTDTTDSSSKDTGAVILEGGLGVEKKIFSGTDITAANQLKSTVAIGTAPLSVISTTKVTNLNADKFDDLESTDFVRLSGTVTETISGLKTFSSVLAVSNTTESTNKDTGSLVLEGGLGVEKAVNVGGSITSSGDITGNSVYIKEDATSGNFALRLYADSGLTANRTLTLNTSNSDRTLAITGNATINQDTTTTGVPQFARVGIGTAADGTANLKLNAGTILSAVVDGATNKGFTLTTPAYSTAGAKLVSVMNSATEKVAFDYNGNMTLGSGTGTKMFMRYDSVTGTIDIGLE